MKYKKIMHIASFKGNAGDIINHTGFYQSLEKYLEKDCNIVQIEMRDFYKNSQKRKFDNKFLKEINECDLLILGGGAFFDARWEDSATGTTIDISKEFIGAIVPLVLVNAMGYSEFWHIEEKECDIYEKFKDFIEYVANKKNWLLTFRNDLSYNLLISRYDVGGGKLTDKIIKVADNGFFYTDWKQLKNCEYPNTIGFNVTNDLFSPVFNNEIHQEKFNYLIADYIIQLSKEHQIILFAHAPQDMKVIAKLMDIAGIENFRSQISIAPYAPNSKSGVDELVKYYSLCDVVIAMRFHANILCMQLGIPVIGLAGHRQIEQLYTELDLLEYYVKVNHAEFCKDVDVMMQKVLTETYQRDIKESYNEVKRLNENYWKKVDVFLKKE